METQPITYELNATSSIANIASALAKAQAEIKPPIKNRTVDFTHQGKRTKYSYADLADVIEAIKLPLSKNQLSVIHQLGYQEDHYGLTTTLMHASGESLDTWYPLPDPGKQQIRAQEFGSALTYARRYSLSSLVGIASEDDDDGQSAAPTPEPKAKPKNQAPSSQQSPQTYPQDEFDQAMASDPMPDHEGRPMSLLEELYALTDEMQITGAEAKDIIKRVTGKNKSTELNDAQIQSVITYIRTVKK